MNNFEPYLLECSKIQKSSVNLLATPAINQNVLKKYPYNCRCICTENNEHEDMEGKFPGKKFKIHNNLPVAQKPLITG